MVPFIKQQEGVHCISVQVQGQSVEDWYSSTYDRHAITHVCT